MEYDIKNIGLAVEGRTRIEWVKAHMPILKNLEDTYKNLPESEKPLHNVRICLSIHLEPKTAYLCLVLKAAGADMSVTGSNVLSTQDSTCAALAAAGIKVYAVHGESEEDYLRHIEMCLEHKPHIVIDDGGDLVGMLHSARKDLAVDVWGGCEETTTGIIRLKAMEAEGILSFPMLAVNDARAKHLFDNRYGTGQSVWTSIMANTNLIIASKTVVVAGYGWCGKGVAMRAAAMGARVIVTEIDPIKAIEARMDGYDVAPMSEAATRGDIFVTVTGCKDVITFEHMKSMKKDAILANAGHFNVEIAMAELEANAIDCYESRANIKAYVIPAEGEISHTAVATTTIHVIAEGRLVNIAASDGHPAEVMDMSFAVQFFGAMYITEHHDELANKVINITDDIDDKVATMRLAAWGDKIDVLTEAQQTYLGKWET
ncbi:MAG: adenosylhomocysteinase [Clostridiales Family XIII bacterium]|nr:adenosylhomocysteinase [Clostridiales Family XIII bacterium]